ncbi:MAG TPA: hypothetical protein VGO47_07055 [Chlamydiales bacterium]|nr:hypothetical protein [Chlamydiales bacterium]
MRNLYTGRESSYSDTLQIVQRNHWQDNSDITGIKGTYFLNGIPTSYVAIPPFQPNSGDPRPPILALRKFEVLCLKMDLYLPRWRWC